MWSLVTLRVRLVISTVEREESAAGLSDRSLRAARRETGERERERDEYGERERLYETDRRRRAGEGESLDREALQKSSAVKMSRCSSSEKEQRTLRA